MAPRQPSPLELRDRLQRCDVYFAIGEEQENGAMMGDAIRMRCRILAETGASDYAMWRTDKS